MQSGNLNLWGILVFLIIKIIISNYKKSSKWMFVTYVLSVSLVLNIGVILLILKFLFYIKLEKWKLYIDCLLCKKKSRFMTYEQVSFRFLQILLQMSNVVQNSWGLKFHFKSSALNMFHWLKESEIKIMTTIELQFKCLFS